MTMTIFAFFPLNMGSSDKQMYRVDCNLSSDPFHVTEFSSSHRIRRSPSIRLIVSCRHPGRFAMQVRVPI